MIRVIYLAISLGAIIFVVLVTGREVSLSCQIESSLVMCSKVVTYYDRYVRVRDYREVGAARVRESCDENGICTDTVQISTEAWFDPSLEWSDGRPAKEVAEEFNLFLQGERGETYHAEFTTSFWRNLFFWIVGGLLSVLFLFLWVDDWRRN